MRVNTESLIIRAATTSTSGTLNDLTTDLIVATNNNNQSRHTRSDILNHIVAHFIALSYGNLINMDSIKYVSL